MHIWCMHPGQELGSKLAPRWPRKKEGGCCFPPPAWPCHTWCTGHRGKGQGWCYSWDSFLVPITQFRASKLRGSPRHSGNNICIYLHISLTTWEGEIILLPRAIINHMFLYKLQSRHIFRTLKHCFNISAINIRPLILFGGELISTQPHFFF